MTRPDHQPEASSETASTASGRTTAVLLCPEGHSQNEPVRRELDEQGWTINPIHHPHLAMAELCVLEKDQRSRSAWGLPRADQLALVIDWPQAAPELEPLLTAVARYLPSVQVWLVGGGAVTSPTGEPMPPTPTAVAAPIESPRLDEPSHVEPEPQPEARPFSFSASLSSQESSHGGMGARSVGGAPPLHLVHADLPLPAQPARATTDVEQDQSEEPAEAVQRITREEIDMLLHQEAEEQST